MNTDDIITRRGLIRNTGVASATLGLAQLGFATASSGPIEYSAPEAEGASMIGIPFDKHDKVRLGLIGTGGRGTGLLSNLLAIEAVEIVALGDLHQDRVERAKAMCDKAGQKDVSTTYGSEMAWEAITKRDDLDLIITATPWIWHVPIVVSAMEHGHHAFTEVPAARTVEDCWKLVNTSEKTRRHCIMMENCCYGYIELLILNMCRAGMFGDITHGGAAYLHDLRGELYGTVGEGEWRRAEHFKRNGNLYPTHGLGPVCNYMNIERGDRLDYMVSMSSPEIGLRTYREKALQTNDPRLKETYACGDQNTSLLKTASGKIIRLEHNVSSPEPYSRINLIAGSKGKFMDYPERIYVDGRDKGDEFVSLDSYKAEFEHKLWTKGGEMARKLGGHGGMDYLMLYRLIECLKEGLTPDMDVYDAATWSAPGPLSELSVLHNSAPVKFPDFTRGAWRQTRLAGAPS